MGEGMGLTGQEVTGEQPTAETDGETHLRGSHTARGALQHHRHSHRPAIMSAAGAPEYDPDAEFVYDYQTLRIGGLTFVAVIMILSVLLLASNKIRQCGKPRQRKIEEVHLP
ncbi:sodium/potassium-transporting ATPase subunit gamma-like isoform X2 [Oncorhynchus kisutch]|uniref:FXYD domain-containing ion transport regulator n=3 Tax=Salmoninae TaxID=504568 RepID=A0A8C7M1L6_ONCKI|nr:sodium/potassium-transporting ATPase subunit gamma-like isoform X2 [Oncorhynchus kisutch]